MSYENPLNEEDAAGRLGLVLMAVIVLMLVICACARADMSGRSNVRPLAQLERSGGVTTGTFTFTPPYEITAAMLFLRFERKATDAFHYDREVGRVTNSQPWIEPRADFVIDGKWELSSHAFRWKDSPEEAPWAWGYGPNAQIPPFSQASLLLWSRNSVSNPRPVVFGRISDLGLYDGRMDFTLHSDLRLDHAQLSVIANGAAPVPGALLLGMIGLGMAGIKLRRFA